MKNEYEYYNDDYGMIEPEGFENSVENYRLYEYYENLFNEYVNISKTNEAGEAPVVEVCI